MHQLLKKTFKTAALLGAMTLVGAAQATSAFEGRLANGTASATCTVSGADKCAMFFNKTLDLTILNDWNIGTGFWSATAAAGSAQALAESAGASQTNFKGWFLPTGNGFSAGSGNQFKAIWDAAGGSFSSLSGHFDGVQSNYYWSGTEYAQYVPHSNRAWIFKTYYGIQTNFDEFSRLHALAVRPGDVTAAVPEPQTWALTLLGLTGVLLARRRRAL
ncbi:PEP-CTERM sorting domain-containing protein [Paucibacter sp. TC2R-5]|uniref:PEP-CTERM sorting domain-containing protein n=1 Tax=Paucibacter sp. TC2R-5 TaxID=2893555 RepID=UPI0021E478D4|nr:PEP-CTERM sorting domain-containing protein [Paucibacter sp. TC2R-5]MCV2361618.1 PEP-CTERM sorting domain-containing protein [Paucibacter sp. TC2R-5]